MMWRWELQHSFLLKLCYFRGFIMKHSLLLRVIYCVSCQSARLLVCFPSFPCTMNFTLRSVSTLITRLPITWLPFSWHLRSLKFIYFLSSQNAWFPLKWHQNLSCFTLDTFFLMEYAGTPTALNYFQKCTTHLHFYPLVSSFTVFPLCGGRCWAGDQLRPSHEHHTSSKNHNILLWELLPHEWEPHHQIYWTGSVLQDTCPEHAPQVTFPLHFKHSAMKFIHRVLSWDFFFKADHLGQPLTFNFQLCGSGFN